MKKSLKIVGIVLLIIVILFVGACFWVNGLKEDKAATKKKTDKILNSYSDFNKSVDEFSTLRNKFYEYKEDLYIETLSTNATAWNDFITSYEAAIKKVDTTAKNLKENCTIEYGDVRANSRCTTFKANYEAANNYYISDAKLYNELIDEYNEYNKKNNNKYAEVNKAKFVVYKDYIDYDKDGEYFGKEEVKKNA